MNQTIKNYFAPKFKFNGKDWLKIFTYFSVFIFFLLFVLFIFFVFYKSIPIWNAKGLSFLTEQKWQPSFDTDGEYGILNFIISTFWTVFFTIILVSFLTIYTSIFITFFLPKWLKKKMMFMMRFFSGIPSICYGVFGAFVFVRFFRSLGIANPESMISAILVLTIMILPTTISLSVNTLDSVNKYYFLSGFALGVKKVPVIYKIIKKIRFRHLSLILFFGFCRAIGEVTAIALIAGNGPQAPPLDEGFQKFFFHSMTTLSSLIGLEINETIGNLHESSLYNVAFILLFIVLFCNLFLNFVLNLYLKRIPKLTQKVFDNSKNKNFKGFYYRFFPNSFWHFKNKISFLVKKIMMFFAFIITFSMLMWVFLDIFINGFTSFFDPNVQPDIKLLWICLTTIILILTTIIFAFPLAFLIAIFLSFYQKKNRFISFFSKIINFFIYQLSSAPTILFGMFGLALFVFFFGYSILSASLTMVLVILPILVQTFKQSFESFPRNQYYNAMALGIKKKDVILKLIMPSLKASFFVGIILAINKIVSESSPILVTMGTALVFPKRTVLSSGRTFATAIYLAQTENNGSNLTSLVYQISFLTLLFIIILNLLIYYLQKNEKMKKWIKRENKNDKK